MTNTLYTIWNTTTAGDWLVLVTKDAMGAVSAKYLDNIHGNEAFTVARALKAVTGEEYDVTSISKSAFIKEYGRRIAREVYLVA